MAMKIFLEWIHSFLQYLKKNPMKIGVLAIISIVITVFYQYSIKFPLLKSTSNETSSSSSLQGEGYTPEGKKGGNSNNNYKMMKNAHRSRLLLRIRKQYDVACKSFLPTLRRRIFETIDVNNTIRQIKELRATGQQLTDIENDLWEDVKISSFGQLFTTIYLLSAVCTLLRIQLHVLARSLVKNEKNLSSGSKIIHFSGNVKEDSSLSQQQQQQQQQPEDTALDTEMFKLLVDGTYRQMFGTGLQTFSNLILVKLRIQLQDWSVKDKVKVDYEEIRQLFENTRKEIESNFEILITELFLPPEAETAVPSNSPGTIDQSVRISPSVQRLLNQIWDIVDSPAFQVVYTETLDSCYRICYEHLRKMIFQPESSPTTGYENLSTFRSPPLASILPQLKSISNRLLPDAVDTPLNNDLRNLSSGALLDSLCISIFDADDSVDS